MVDLTGSDESIVRIRRVIRDINRCTRGDRIYVLGRRMADIGNALSIVSRERSAPGRCHPVVRDPTGMDWNVGDSPGSLPARRQRAAVAQVTNASLRGRHVGLAPRG